MATREVCSNDYVKNFEIVRIGRSRVFEGVEGAPHAFAPTCADCDCRIIDRGLEADGLFFCRASCAKHYGVQAWKDRAPRASA